MVIYEQDLDVLQWGLRLLDGDPVYNSGYYGDTAQQDAQDMYHQQYIGGHYDTRCNHEDQDTLHEGFSQLAITDGSGYSHSGQNHFQPSYHSNEWSHHSTRKYHLDHAYGLQESDDLTPSSSCSSPGDADGYSYSLELTDEYVTDGEVGERLNQMIPIPHVPRINGEMPSSDEVTSDYQRLLDRLQIYDFTEHKVQGDGNCQFLALSDQLYRSPEHHKFVRRQVVDQLKSHPDSYEGYVPMAYDDYLDKMSRSGEWGDHVTLQAAADSYGVKIFVITSFKDTCYIEILPNTQKSKRVIFLSFWAEVHYNSIYPQGDMPSYEFRKKKKWWMFGNKH